MKNVKIVKFKTIEDLRGKLTPLETFTDIPFDIKRTYYIYDVASGEKRGFHSHNKLEQMLICLKGSVSIDVEAKERQTFLLNSPDEGLYIGPMVWREMFDFSPDAVLIVFASQHYDESDYIRNYEEFKNTLNCD